MHLGFVPTDHYLEENMGHVCSQKIFNTIQLYIYDFQSWETTDKTCMFLWPIRIRESNRSIRIRMDKNVFVFKSIRLGAANRELQTAVRDACILSSSCILLPED